MDRAQIITALRGAAINGDPDPNRIAVGYTRFASVKKPTGGVWTETTLGAYAAERERLGAQIVARGEKHRCPVHVSAKLSDGHRCEESVLSVHWLFFDSDDTGPWDQLLAALDEVGVAYLAQRSTSDGAGGADKWHLFLPLASARMVPASVPLAEEKIHYSSAYLHLCAVLQELGGLRGHDQSVSDLSRAAYIPQRLDRYAAARRVVVRGGRLLSWGDALRTTHYRPPVIEAPKPLAAVGGVVGPGIIHDDGTDGGPTPGETTGSLLLRAASQLGLLGREVSPGRYLCLCPWRHEHSSPDPQHHGEHHSSSVIFTAAASAAVAAETGRPAQRSGGYVCLHAHCAQRRAGAFLSWARKAGADLPDTRRWSGERRARDPCGGWDAPPRNATPPTAGTVEGEDTKTQGEDPMSMSKVADTMSDVQRQAPIIDLGAVRARVEHSEAVAAVAQRLLRSSSGAPRPVAANVITVLTHDPRWAGVLAYDELSLRIVTMLAPPWHRDDAGGSAVGPWTDDDDTRLTSWLVREYSLQVASAVAYAGVSVAAKAHAYHPVRDYLSSLTWDGTPRLESWLHRLLGAAPSRYHALAGRYWLLSAVARAMSPGAKVDTMLVLEGPQGLGKSQAIAALVAGVPGRSVYADTPIDLGSKDRFGAVRGVWIYEWAELAGLSRRDAETVKAFLSSREDKYRPPYGRQDVIAPRSVVFAASVNPREEDDGAYLHDSTGGRRFWPVCCGQISLQGIVEERDQLWAEAMQVYREGGDAARWWASSEDEQIFADEQRKRSEGADVWDEPISRWIRGGCYAAPAYGAAPDAREPQALPISAANVLLHALQRPIERQSKADRDRVGRCLRRLGFAPRSARVAGVGVCKVFARDYDGEAATVYGEACALVEQIADLKRREAARDVMHRRLTLAQLRSVLEQAAEIIAQQRAGEQQEMTL